MTTNEVRQQQITRTQMEMARLRALHCCYCRNPAALIFQRKPYCKRCFEKYVRPLK